MTRIPTEAGVIAGIFLMLYGIGKIGDGQTMGRANCTGQQLVNEALRYLNRPYYLGAGQDANHPDPPYIDCGLLTKKALAPYGITVPRTVTEQVQLAPTKIEISGKSYNEIKNLLRTGDMIGFDWNPGGRYSHTGIWTGNTVLHASSTIGKVTKSNLEHFSLGGFRTIYSFTR